jgi:hypothetical protein
MIVEVIRVGNEIALPELFAHCMNSLTDSSRIVAVHYPEEIRTAVATVDDWLIASDSVARLNASSLFDHLENGVNCYAIHTRLEPRVWKMRYLGHVESRRARTTITGHLLPGTDGNGVIFKKCKAAVGAGEQIGLSLIRVEPDSLRDFIQEKAIGDPALRNLLDWNRGR